MKTKRSNNKLTRNESDVAQISKTYLKDDRTREGHDKTENRE